MKSGRPLRRKSARWPHRGFALSPLSAAAVPELSTAIAHLRNVLGDQAYESFARKGETMTTAEMVTYAYDQIDVARVELNSVSKETRDEGPITWSQILAAPDDLVTRVSLRHSREDT